MPDKTLAERIDALNDFAAKVGFDHVPADTSEAKVVGLEELAASYTATFPVGHPLHPDSVAPTRNEAAQLASDLIDVFGPMNALRIALALSPDRKAQAPNN